MFPRRQLRAIIFLLFTLFLVSQRIEAQKFNHFQSDEYDVEESISIHKTSLYKELYSEYLELRTREIKRRLALDHGYDSREISAMIHKPELVHALCREVYKAEKRKRSDLNRKRFMHIAATIVIASVIYFLSPVWMQGYDIFTVNFVVYTDRKRHEASRCMEIGSVLGFIGFLLLCILELLSFWLSASVFFSWFMTRNKYFFPTPHIPIRPGAFLNSATGGNPGSRQGIAGYAINCGPMVISWVLSFLNGRVQAWMGSCLSKAQRKQKQAKKEAKKQRAAKKAARKAKREARENEMKSSKAGEEFNAQSNTHENDENQFKHEPRKELEKQQEKDISFNADDVAFDDLD